MYASCSLVKGDESARHELVTGIRGLATERPSALDGEGFVETDTMEGIREETSDGGDVAGNLKRAAGGMHVR